MTKDELIRGYTGSDSAYWVGRIQSVIERYFDADPGNPHPHCDTGTWLPALVGEIVDAHELHMSRPLPRRGLLRRRPQRQPYDENMSATLVVAAILATWTMRLGRTKAYDPRRPVALRRKALERARENASALVDAVFDESLDTTYFELPSWDNPMAPNATDGDFV